MENIFIIQTHPQLSVCPSVPGGLLSAPVTVTPPPPLDECKGGSEAGRWADGKVLKMNPKVLGLGV